MSNLMIVLLGLPGSGTSVLGTWLAQQRQMHFFPSLGITHRRKTGPEFLSPDAIEELIMHAEFERDKEILQLLQSGHSVVIEDWHLANCAYARVRAQPVADVYEFRLIDHIRLFTPRVFYLSYDLDRVYPESIRGLTDSGEDKYVATQSFFSKWLSALSVILSRFQIHTWTLDGTPPVSQIQKRALYVLKEIDVY